MSNTGSFKPSNSGIAGVRPKRSDWKTKTKRPGIDFGRRKKLGLGGSEKSPYGETLAPGLGKKARKFMERFIT
jgi:hypothetical protein